MFQECNPIYDAYCTNHYGNGHCDKGCDTAECGWDGMDCDQDKVAPTDGSLVIIILMPVNVS